MIHIYNKIRTLAATTLMACLALAATGCAGSQPGQPGGDEGDEGLVELCFVTGNGGANTRAAFADGTPVRLFVYQCPTGGGNANLKGTPYRTVEGTTEGTTGELSTVRLTGGDLTDGKLIVSSGRIYEIVAIVDGTPAARIENIGMPNAGIIAGFGHGRDILAAKQTVNAAYGAKQVNVTFTANGADANGNLPHLGSAVVVEATVTEELLTQMGGQVTMAVAGMDFKQCLPQSANLLFENFGAAALFNVLPAGNITSFSANLLTDEQPVANTTTKVTSADGYILPYPLATAGRDYNLIHADFRLRVNGGQNVFEANGIQVPAFKPGYRYRFILEFDYPDTQGKINLYLSIEPWQAMNWDSTMGADEGTAEQFVKVAVGSWSAVRWSSTMGDEDQKQNVIVSIAGWTGITWNHDMGEEE